MSKVFGFVLLIGLVGSVLLSIGLLMFMWIRASNEPAKTIPAPPTTKAALLHNIETSGYRLVDARQVVAATTFNFLES